MTGPGRPEMMFASRLASFRVVAVLVAGIVLAVARWRRNSRTALLVIFAMGLPLVLDFSVVYLSRLPAYLRWLYALTPPERGLVFGIEQALAQTARAASCVLLLIAAFRRRGGDKTTQPKCAPGQPPRPPSFIEKWLKAGGVSSQQ
jgi:hypothetical protein